MSPIEHLESQLALEREARRQTEAILEEKKRELQLANEQLSRLINEQVGELKKSERHYRHLVESVQDIIFKTSVDGYFTFVNPVVEQCLGYTESEIIGLSFLSLVLPAYRGAVVEFYQKMFQTGQLSSYIEFPVVAKDGRTVWIGQTLRVIEGEKSLPELVAVARDITDRIVNEDIFRTTQARLTSLITNLQTGILVEDENRKVILVNQLYCDLFEISLTPDELIGRDYVELAKPPKELFANPDQFIHHANDIVREQHILVKETVSLVDGRFLERDYIPIFLEGQYRGHLWQYTDITEKYRYDERIRLSEEKYRGIMNRMELGLLEVDKDQIIKQAYDRFCQMVGYTEEELIGQRADELLVPQEYNEFLGQQQKFRGEGAANSYEMQLKRKDGERIWVIISGAPIIDEGGNVTGSMGIHYDISERKRLEEELAHAKLIAEDARHTEKQFLANMSHEIRTPLNAILGFSNLLGSTSLSLEQKEFVDYVRTAGKNLLTIVNDILDISKIEAGMLPLESIPFSISSLVDSIRTMLDASASDKNLLLKVTAEPNLPPVVLGDPTRLTQILLNLLSNAIKFTKQGGIYVRIENREETGDSARIRFTVEDTGIGMEPSILPHIFERFRQASDFTTRYYGGTGLGLNIVKSLTEMQGGWIEVKSKLGEGSVFTVEIPYQVAPNQADHEVYLTEDTSGSVGREVSILVVEDNVMNQKLALQVLNRLGYSAQVAENGQKALDLLEREEVDLVLMDIQMPVMDGYTTTSHIRNKLKSQVPIIAMTAHALANEREQCLQAGMNDFIPKPFQIEELQRIMRKYLPTASAKAPTQPAFVPPKPSFVVEPLLEAVGGDMDFAVEMMNLFLFQTPGEIQQLRQSLEEGDLTSVKRLIHTQKAVIQTFGLNEAARLITSSETMIAEKKAMAEIVPVVEQYLAVLESELPAIQSVLDTQRKSED
ncbi:PAS domain S-box protein [Larkinella rosea]|uniref:Sensory/regulatory protein RpfC n=1 Tax=Larkinella rosea TaxID=2025312 RepID=A0A3P1BJS3_9BACT|nr:PAS domain S-box protein [Larkinella rosea]RRB00674.1 PAS domain S-box protein [Larkinella rosea]